MTATDAPQSHRTITDEKIAALERRLGIPVRRTLRPHVVVASEDSIRHFANGIGQDDPVYCDPDYGRAGPWGSVIAPPLYLQAIGIREPVEWTPEQEAAMSGGDPLAGIGQYMIRESWTFYRPVQPGVTMMQRQSLHRVEPRRSETDGRISVRLTHFTTHLTADDSVYATTERTFHHADRHETGPGGAKAAAPFDPPRYDDAAMAEIDACYAAETQRGAQPRTADSVTVGESIGRIVRGPLTVTDIMGYHMGTGWGGFGVPPTRLAWKARQRMPKLFVPNSQGVPDTVQRCHWEDEWAQSLGQPLAYDYGAMRSNWTTALIRNWMGDSGWLWKFESRIRRFNHRGDTTWISGAVTAVDRERGSVDVEIEGVNQRGVQTCTATATILLPAPGAARPAIPEPQPA
jgi:acyl dehydratase